MYSPVPRARSELRLLQAWLLGHEVQLTAYYVPAHANVVADYLSRHPLTVQVVHPSVFSWVRLTYGPTIDRFAAANDHQLPTYNTYLPEPGSAGVDCFAAQDWHLHRNWCHPPPHILGKFLSFLVA